MRREKPEGNAWEDDVATTWEVRRKACKSNDEKR